MIEIFLQAPKELQALCLFFVLSVVWTFVKY